MTEVWKDIEGYEGKYKVSNMGMIRGVERLDSLGRNVGAKTLKQGTDKDGYKKVFLSKNGISKCFLVHRIVATAFIKKISNI